MTKEIYCRIPSDVQYKPQIECDSELETILQQIRVILGTKKGEVLGNYTFGINLEDYLFQYNVNTEIIRNELSEMINQYLAYDTNKWNVSVDVNYGKDYYNKSDYAVVDIIINQRKVMGVLVN